MAPPYKLHIVHARYVFLVIAHHIQNVDVSTAQHIVIATLSLSSLLFSSLSPTVSDTV